MIKMIILEENFKWHLEAFASELFIYFIVLVIRLAVILEVLMCVCVCVCVCVLTSLWLLELIFLAGIATLMKNCDPLS